MKRLGLQLGSLLLRALCVSLFASWSLLSQAEEPTAPDEIAFRQALKDMSNDLRLMCVAAHPDDEDGATLAYYRYKHGVKTYALIGTRGEGGQNEIGPELYEDLAVIRTKEMIEAAKIEGAELHFLDMPEFGFSKTIEETLEKWGKDVLLEKMVRKIREIRPHVIITHHGRMKDHGHHQAIGWAVQEAFTVAADANAFPESGEPWQVQRLYIRDFTGESKDAVVVNINEKDELRGKTYAEIAADALRAHKSQGMEQFIEMLLSGEAKASYSLAKTGSSGLKNKNKHDLDSILFQNVEHAVSINLSHYVTEKPSRQDSHALMELAKEIETITEPGEGWHELWLSLRQTAFSVSGEEVRAYPEDVILVRGQTTRLNIFHPQLQGGQKLPFFYKLFRFPAPRQGVALDNHLLLYATEIHSDTERIKDTLQFEWIVTNNEQYTLPIARHFQGRSMLDPQVEVVINFGNSNAGGWDGMLSHSLVDFEVAPPVLPEFLDAPYLIRQSQQQSVLVPVRLTNYTPGAHTQEVRFAAPEGWVISLHGPDGPDGQAESKLGPSGPSSPLSPLNTLTFNAAFTQEDEQRSIELLLTAPDSVPVGSYVLTAETEGLDFTPEAKVQVVEVALPEGRSIGLIDSYDTTFRDVMSKLHLEHERITESGITPENLNRFSTIIVDMRAYGKRPDLKENNAALLEWCKRGGTLIVNYHKTFDWSPDFAPYPISLSNNRVTREDAPVKLLVPEHPWFNSPNKITPEDWDGWRQERGLYFPQKWDDAYTPLIETTDPDEVIPPGSCLIADYGEGKYFYTSLVWYRQLRELHPGALKLFANLLAL